MKIKSPVLPLLLSPLFLLMASCFHAANKKIKIDPFYTDKGEWDSARIPFLKPYEAVNVTKEFGWSINLKGLDGDTGFPNIRKANVIDSVIIIYSINTILHGLNVKQAWHIIIPGKRFEKGFASHDDYVSCLKKLGIKNEPRFYDIDSIANYYESHDTINWKAIN